MRIFVKTIVGKITPLEVDPHDTIQTIKESILNIEEIPVCHQNFIFHGRELENTQTLYDSNIQDNDTIHLITTLRGKPVILFYPPASGAPLTDVTTSVTLLHHSHSFTTLYPKPQSTVTTPEAKTITWNISEISPDGTLTLNDDSHTKCTYLFWECTWDPQHPVVGLPALLGDPTSTMLTDGMHAGEFIAGVLDALGMTPRERDDMVTFWLHSVIGAKHLMVRVVRQSDLDLCDVMNVGKVSDGGVEVSVHRVCLLIHPCESVSEEIAEKMVRTPCVPLNVRDEFPIVRDPSKLNVVEWGGILLY